MVWVLYSCTVLLCGIIGLAAGLSCMALPLIGGCMNRYIVYVMFWRPMRACVVYRAAAGCLVVL